LQIVTTKVITLCPRRSDPFYIVTMVLQLDGIAKHPALRCIRNLEIHPCPRNCPRIRVGEAMIANYYQRTFTRIQSNFGGFLHYKDIIK